ncbi:hypothetical protein V6Z11_D01G225800 [Gossypium hirsutum]
MSTARLFWTNMHGGCEESLNVGDGAVAADGEHASGAICSFCFHCC